jgi:hypothetical protein
MILAFAGRHRGFVDLLTNQCCQLSIIGPSVPAGRKFKCAHSPHASSREQANKSAALLSSHFFCPSRHKRRHLRADLEAGGALRSILTSTEVSDAARFLRHDSSFSAVC